MDWFNQLIAFIKAKIPNKYFLITALVTASLIFLPEDTLNIFSLSNFSKRYKELIGLIFIISSICFIISISIPFCSWISKLLNDVIQKLKVRHQNKKKIRRVLLVLRSLPHSEICILREFALQNRDVIKGPIDDPDITSLLNKNIIYLVSSQKTNYAFGVFGLYSLHEFIQPFITYDLLGIPIPQDINEESSRRLNSERPTFVKNLGFVESLLKDIR